jgi:hypothetical protein
VLSHSEIKKNHVFSSYFMHSVCTKPVCVNGKLAFFAPYADRVCLCLLSIDVSPVPFCLPDALARLRAFSFTTAGFGKACHAAFLAHISFANLRKESGEPD